MEEINRIVVKEKRYWKKRLYDKYVTTGQAVKCIQTDRGICSKNEHYLNDIIKNHIPTNKKIKIFDLACGNGGFIHLLKKAGYHNIYGVDISPEQVKLANDLGISEVVEGEIGDFLNSFDVQADVILMIDILEHFTKRELFKTLDIVYNSLLPGGKLIVHVPNAEGLFGMRVRYGDITHVSAFTPKSIRQLLTIIGFKKIISFEDKPIPHGVISLIRRIIWGIGTLRIRLLLSAETGGSKFILSQNMLTIAIK